MSWSGTVCRNARKMFSPPPTEFWAPTVSTGYRNVPASRDENSDALGKRQFARCRDVVPRMEGESHWRQFARCRDIIAGLRILRNVPSGPLAGTGVIVQRTFDVDRFLALIVYRFDRSVKRFSL